MNSLQDSQVSRIIGATLSLTRGGRSAHVDEIAAKARVSCAAVKDILEGCVGPLARELVGLAPIQRLQLATKIPSLESLEEVARSLTWQEFEEFVEECLARRGFAAERNVRFAGGGRRWQIDVVGSKGPLVLCFDCKHWKPPSSISRFEGATLHQTKATAHLAASGHPRISISKDSRLLPVILTLHSPPRRFYKDNVLLSIDKLSDFLDQVTPLDHELPFVVPNSDSSKTL
jgi:Holliday junction resolvase